MQKNVENQKIPWWVVVILILLGIYFFNNYVLGGASYCVDECVSDMSLCAENSYTITKSLNFYLTDDDFDDCKYELESCVSNC